jgi:hypothetical protein
MYYNHYKEIALHRFASLTPSAAEYRVTNLGVHNISSYNLTADELRLLSLGIKFVPTPQYRQDDEFMQDLQDWKRRVRIHHMFADSHDRIDSGFNPRTYAPNTRFEPKPASPELETYMRAVESRLACTLLSNRTATHGHENLPKRLRKAIKSLRGNKKIRIRYADKNVGITVMDATWEFNQARKHLSDTRNYKHLTPEELQHYAAEAYSKAYDLIVRRMKKMVSTATHRFLCISLTNQEPCTFYVVPKLHKTPISTRPIAASHSWTTTGLSIWVDSMLQPVVHAVVDSYVVNSFAVVCDLEKLVVPPDAFLTTWDVESLYPNIPISIGLQAVRWALYKYNEYDERTITTILQALELILRWNILEHAGEHWLQLFGTAMGTPVAPTFAVIFLGYLEQERLWPFWKGPKPLYFKRYIDDIFIIWSHSLSSLQKLRTYYDTRLPSIKVTGRIKDDSVNFLDIVIYKGDRFKSTGILDTRSATKSVNLYLYIPGKSWHTEANMLAWVTSELNRHVRLCSSYDTYASRARLFYSHLRARGYASHWLVKVFKSINYLESRSKALEKGPRTVWSSGLSPPLHIKTYHNTRLSAKLWRLILAPVTWNGDPIDLPPHFQRTLLCFKRERNLGEILTKAKFPPGSVT